MYFSGRLTGLAKALGYKIAKYIWGKNKREGKLGEGKGRQAFMPKEGGKILPQAF